MTESRPVVVVNDLDRHDKQFDQGRTMGQSSNILTPQVKKEATDFIPSER